MAYEVAKNETDAPKMTTAANVYMALYLPFIDASRSLIRMSVLKTITAIETTLIPNFKRQ